VRTLFNKDGGSLQIWTSAVFGAKSIGFFEFYGVFARTRVKEVEPVRTFCGQERGQLFAILCGRPLWSFNAEKDCKYLFSSVLTVKKIEPRSVISLSYTHSIYSIS